MKPLIAVVACCSAFLFLTCSNPSSGNGSDVGNPSTGLTGHLVDGRSKKAANGATVRIYPVYLNKMARVLGKVATDVPAIDSTSTDNNGAYQFDSLANGIYTVEGEKIDSTDTLTMRHSSVIFVGSENLGYDTLQLPGSIKGKVVVPSGESAKSITCYIPGTSYIAITNDTGAFRITGIPAGTYSLSTTSAKFNDTTIYGLKVTPNHETDAGYILLGLDRSKNEHDVWGVFDTTYNIKAIDSIEARVSGDSIPADSPRVYSLDWRPALSGYSGFIYVPDGGFFWTVDIWVFDTLGRRIGMYRVPTINRATGDVQVPNFNPFNSIPVITLNDTTVSINDSIPLRPVISKLSDDSIVSMEWKIGSAMTFTPKTNKDTLIFAPNDSAHIPCVFRVTDKFGNIGIGTALISVIIDPPTAEAGNDTVVSIKDTIRLHGTGSDLYGRIVKWEWDIGAKGHFVRTSSGDTAIIAPSIEDSVFTCVLRVTDDDSNKTTDTVHIQVLKDVPVLNIGPDTIIRVTTSKTFVADVLQQFGTIVMYTWKYMGSEATWIDSGSTMPNRPVTFNSLGEKKVICQVRDDDGNVAADTANIMVVTEISGVLPMSTILTESGSPYAVKGSLLVQTGGKLTIEPGTIVRIDPGVSMTINGTLDAEGTSSKKIVFQLNSLDTTGSSPSWGLTLANSSICKLSNDNVTFGGINSSSSSINVNSCSFISTSISSNEGTIALDSCQFSNTGIGVSSWAAEGTGQIELQYNNFNKTSGINIFGNNAVLVGNIFTDNISVGTAGGLTIQGYSLIISSNHVTDGREFDVQGGGLMDSNLVQNSAANGLKINGWSGTFWPHKWTITNNTVSDNAGNGVFISDISIEGNPVYIIQNNTIGNNAGSGILVSYSGANWTCNIRNNNLSYNGSGSAPSGYPYFNAGIVCPNPLSTIDSNIIITNNIGVICASGDILTSNNIYSNTDLNFRVLVNDAGDITAPNNWWGTTDTAQIQTKIYDYNDDNGAGKLLIDPIAPAAISGAGVK
jgi:hypothetical protein